MEKGGMGRDRERWDGEGWQGHGVVCWLVVGHMRRGSWAMVKRVRWWVVITACGQWTVAGDRSQAAGGRRGRCLCPPVGAGRHSWAVVVGCGHLWLGGGVISGRWWSFS